MIHPIYQLVEYALNTGLIEPEDRIYSVNSLMEVMQLDEIPAMEEAELNEELPPVHEILDALIDIAAEKGLVDAESIVARDLFDTKLMGRLTPPPSVVIDTFDYLYGESPEEATNWYYDFSQATNYIRRDRIAKDMKWYAPTEFGDLHITINLSKPEKDPKAIAAAGKAAPAGYPKCQLCAENEGYAGRINHPARQNHRIIPLEINESPWFFQYSPYVYYNEHCIVFNSKHTPMKIDRSCFRKLLDFVKTFPHYFVGSNADLPIVGGSILSHDHFQGGHYIFPMEVSPVEEEFSVDGYEDVQCGIVRWPMSVLRLVCEDDQRLVELADHILGSWRGYTDEAAFIFAETDGVPHNTITPIARFRDGKYELDLVLRNNITTEEHPLGVYHPHDHLHHIKKENIGLIEVMGLAVLPARLKEELAVLADQIGSLTGDALVKAMKEDPRTEKHADWVVEFLPKYETVNAENAMEIVQNEVGIVFSEVLECAGVYKRTEEGREALRRFLAQL
ncbi:MAG: UDP-glucose--hexose-1-phosphate uridylyltransferase [Firmicutes bacterium]|nr:UDP-glucose--hexose-1-phosphate uridylyltransferase [Bacillota bacterium]